MKKLLRVRTLMIAVILCVVSGTSFAQSPTPYRAQPFPFPNPAYSLLRRREGILPNYYQYMLPQQRLQRILESQDRQLQLQRAGIGRLNRDVQRIGRTGGLAPTGIGGHFMDYSHFYPGLSGR